MGLYSLDDLQTKSRTDNFTLNVTLPYTIKLESARKLRAIQKYPKHRLHATLVAICKLRNVRHKLIHLLRNLITIKRAVIKRTPFPRPFSFAPLVYFYSCCYAGAHHKASAAIKP